RTCRRRALAAALPSRCCCTTPASSEIYTLSLHDALPICGGAHDEDDVWPSTHASCSSVADFHAKNAQNSRLTMSTMTTRSRFTRSEEHTSELQSRENLVCRLLLEKKKIPTKPTVRRSEYT